ncbi:MAG: DUF2508 family protein [Clostridia bacterium]|nr:DUF2508 family protein [Clostridia bacterium]
MDIIRFFRAGVQKVQKDGAAPEWANPEMVTLNDEIERVRGLLQAARNNFNFVTEPDMVEYYIYLQKAYEVRYDMLVRKLKEQHHALQKN